MKKKTKDKKSSKAKGKGGLKTKAKKKKHSTKTTTKTLLQKWVVEAASDEDSGSDYPKTRPSKKGRGASQSKVAGEVRPEPHAREHQRKVQSPTFVPKGLGQGKRKLGGIRKTDPKNILATERVTEHPNQSFKSKPGNVLYCLACATEVSKKQSSIITHIKVFFNTTLSLLSRSLLYLYVCVCARVCVHVPSTHEYTCDHACAGTQRAQTQEVSPCHEA